MFFFFFFFVPVTDVWVGAQPIVIGAPGVPVELKEATPEAVTAFLTAVSGVAGHADLTVRSHCHFGCVRRFACATRSRVPITATPCPVIDGAHRYQLSFS